MSFINAVICGGAGYNLDFRMHMRYEFIHLGLTRLIDVSVNYLHLSRDFVVFS